MMLADGFEKAFIGTGCRFNIVVAVYDYSKCVKILMKRDKMSEDEAEEWMSYNVIGAWVGEDTPVFVHLHSLKTALEEFVD
jgi:hypothetical protein